MTICWEAMVDEARAERAEADARRHFTEEKRPIALFRNQLRDWTEVREAEDIEIVVNRSASSLSTAAKDDLFEVG